MYRNIDAEKARKNLTNSEVAEKLGISRTAFEQKKKSGRFTPEEAKKLCRLFSCDFEYLFSLNS